MWRMNCVRMEFFLDPSSKPARFLSSGIHSYTYHGPAPAPAPAPPSDTRSSSGWTKLLLTLS